MLEVYKEKDRGRLLSMHACFLNVDVEKEDISENKDELATTFFTRISCRNDDIRGHHLWCLLGDQERCLGAKEERTYLTRKGISGSDRGPHIRCYLCSALALTRVHFACMQRVAPSRKVIDLKKGVICVF